MLSSLLDFFNLNPYQFYLLLFAFIVIGVSSEVIKYNDKKNRIDEILDMYIQLGIDPSNLNRIRTRLQKSYWVDVHIEHIRCVELLEEMGDDDN